LRSFDLDDDVARRMVLGGKDKDLDDLSGSAAGRALLDRIYDHLITGSLSAGDEQAARRVLQAKTRQIPLETYIEGAQRAQIFPVRQMGITRWSDSPLEAEKLPNGNIRVKLVSRARHTDMFAEEVKTLDLGVFSGRGIELPPDQIVGVRDYGLGEDVEFFPAESLLMLSSKSETSTLGTIASVSMMGAGFGLSGGAAGATGLGRALIWADRVAMGIGALGTVVNEHREWATRTLGAKFVRAVDVANNVAMVYGVGRLAQAGGSVGYAALTKDLCASWQTIRKRKGFARLEADPASRALIAEMDRAIATLPEPPPSLGKRVVKAVDEWAEKPAGGLSNLGVKEADELLKAGWRKLRKPKQPKTAPAGAAAKKTKAAAAKKAKSTASKKPKTTTASPKAKKVRKAKSSVPPIEKRVLTGALDEHGRATYVLGELRPSDLHKGTKTGAVYPPGLTRGELDPLGPDGDTCSRTSSAARAATRATSPGSTSA
jgi:hypothetical protein